MQHNRLCGHVCIGKFMYMSLKSWLRSRENMNALYYVMSLIPSCVSDSKFLGLLFTHSKHSIVVWITKWTKDARALRWRLPPFRSIGWCSWVFSSLPCFCTFTDPSLLKMKFYQNFSPYIILSNQFQGLNNHMYSPLLLALDGSCCYPYSATPLLHLISLDFTHTLN